MNDGDVDVRYAPHFSEAEVDALEADLKAAGVGAVLQESDVRAGSALPTAADLVLTLYAAGVTVAMEEMLHRLVDAGVAAVRRHRPPAPPPPTPAPAPAPAPAMVMRVKDLTAARELEVLLYEDGISSSCVVELPALMRAVFGDPDRPGGSLVFDPQGPSITPSPAGP